MFILKPDVEPEFNLPEVPILNERLKIKPDDVHKMEDIIQNYWDMGVVASKKRELEHAKQLIDGIKFPNDDAFVWSPKVIEFKVLQRVFDFKDINDCTNCIFRTL